MTYRQLHWVESSSPTNSYLLYNLGEGLYESCKLLEIPGPCELYLFPRPCVFFCTSKVLRPYLLGGNLLVWREQLHNIC